MHEKSIKYLIIRLIILFGKLTHYDKSSKKIENCSFPKEASEEAARQNIYVLLVKEELGFSRVVVSKGIKMNFEQNYLWRVERVNELPTPRRPPLNLHPECWRKA